MELYIETLTGTAFELRVSPFETILSVKAKIQRLEGIPISQQHLIWASMELEDDYCLHDYQIQDGATLKLVLAMRGGPINTRRVPMDDPALREMAEYMESNRDELLDKLPGNSSNSRQVTLLVYREGDQLNFFRVVDRGDGTLTPLSESLSGASVYNLYDDEDDDGSPVHDNVEENTRMKEKMRLLRSKMENLTVTKKPKTKKVPHPPSGRPKSRSRHRHHLVSSAGKIKHHPGGPYTVIPKSYPALPPVNQYGKTYATQQAPAAPGFKLPVVKGTENTSALLKGRPVCETDVEAVKSADRNSKLSESSISPGANPGTPLIGAPGMEPQCGGGLSSRPKMSSRASQEDLEAILKRQIKSPRSLSRQKITNNNNHYVHNNNNNVKDSSNNKNVVVMDSPQRPVTSSKKRETPLALQTVRESQPLLNPDATSIKRKVSSPRHGKNSPTLKKDVSNHSNVSSGISRPVTSSRHKQGQGLLLESLTSQEARGLLRQTSLERLGSSNIAQYVRSASKSRSGYYTGERIYTPEGTRISSRVRRSAGRKGCLSPRLPPVKQKKKSKRCYYCAKKTGLASSYQCRCGNNFCASHRYAETHGCTFDYKSEGRKLLEQSNPVISAPKLPKI